MMMMALLALGAGCNQGDEHQAAIGEEQSALIAAIDDCGCDGSKVQWSYNRVATDLDTACLDVQKYCKGGSGVCTDLGGTRWHCVNGQADPPPID
jgi:hypothetical protein